MKQYDVIVVGAGNAGLSAAATLTKAGRKVLVLEKHNLPGGCATSFVRGRFEFEATLHEMCSMGDHPEGPVRKLLNSYGLDVEWVSMDESFRSIVYGAGGYDVTMPVGIEPFITEMEKQVPGSRDSMEQLFQFMNQMKDATDWLEAHDNDPKGIAVLELIVKFNSYLKAVPVSTDEMLRRFEVPDRARQILESYWEYLSAEPKNMSSVIYAFMLYTFLVQKPWIARHRSHEISMAFDTVIRGHGGDIWYNTEVSRIDVENGQVLGVTLANGKQIPCRHVIANLMPTVVYGRMMNPKEVPEREKKLIHARKLGQHCVSVYLGLDIPYRDFGLKGYDIFFWKQPEAADQYRNCSSLDLQEDYCVTILNEVIPDCSPEGTTMVHIVRFYTEDVFADMTPETYFQRKDQLAEEMIRHLETTAGIDIRSHIEEIEVAMPMTWAKYLGTPMGAVYGYEPRLWDGMFPRVRSQKYDNPIHGLRFTGGHSTHMVGYSQTYQNGAEQAKAVLKELKEEET